MGILRQNGDRRTWWSMPQGNVEDISSWLSSADPGDVVGHIAELRFSKVAFSNAIEHLNLRLLACTAERDAAEKKLADVQLEVGSNEVIIRDLREQLAVARKARKVSR
jgi:hypothetical protein